MAPADNLYSRFVGFTKVILPLMAVALLSTLFLFARNNGGSTEIPISELEALAREQRITAPEFSGVAADGSVIKISARFAKPEDGSMESLSISEPTLTLDASDGTSLKIFAGEGVIDGASRTARLAGLARLETSSGYLMETTSLSADLDTGRIKSDGRLAIMAPFGELEAGRVEILVTSSGTGQEMRFTNGVRLLYKTNKIE